MAGNAGFEVGFGYRHDQRRMIAGSFGRPSFLLLL